MILQIHPFLLQFIFSVFGLASLLFSPLSVNHRQHRFYSALLFNAGTEKHDYAGSEVGTKASKQLPEDKANLNEIVSNAKFLINRIRKSFVARNRAEIPFNRLSLINFFIPLCTSLQLSAAARPSEKDAYTTNVLRDEDFIS